MRKAHIKILLAEKCRALAIEDPLQSPAQSSDCENDEEICEYSKSAQHLEDLF